MRFDWIKFCEQHHVSFVTSGANVGRGNVNIRCPWCGNSDPSEHMGLSRDARNPVWGCLRNAKHRGRDPARLVSKLLDISMILAKSMVAESGPRLDDYDKLMEEFRERETGGKPEPIKKVGHVLELPAEFRPISSGYYSKRFVGYLSDVRGFGVEDARRIAQEYELYYALTGPQRWRLIFPLRNRRNDLIGWQGREIREGATIRYLTSPDLPESALLGFGKEDGSGVVLASPMQRLIVVEGPLDALKLDFYGREFGLRTIASMGTGASAARISALRSLKAERTFVIFDSDAFAQAMEFCEQLPNSRWVRLPDQVKDPGEMNVTQVRNFLTKIAEMS